MSIINRLGLPKNAICFVKNLLAIFLVFIGIFFYPSAYALDNGEKKAELIAEKIDYDAKSHSGVYKGQVHFTYAGKYLDADFAQTQFDEKNQLIYALAKSTTKNLVHFWGKTKENEPEIHAYAKKMEYFPGKNLLVLKDNAIVIQGENKMQAPVIEYNLATCHVITHVIDGVRTRLIINLKNNKI